MTSVKLEGKSPVRLRMKPLQKGGYSLYLDIYSNGSRHYEFLKLYLKPEKTAADREVNKVTMQAAKTIEARRLIEMNSGKAGIIISGDTEVTMYDFFSRVINEKKYLSESYLGALQKTQELWKKFAGYMKLKDVSYGVLLDFQDFLSKTKGNLCQRGCKKAAERLGMSEEEFTSTVLRRLREGASQRGLAREYGVYPNTIALIQRKVARKLLKPSTVSGYFLNVGTVLNRAVKLGLIPFNPMSQFDRSTRVKIPEKERAFLTIEEVRALSSVDMYEGSKRMFLFACFTGLRYSDVLKVTWDMIDSGRISLTQKKTNHVVYVPISQNALTWVPERTEDPFLFKPLPNLYTINRHLDKMAKAAGIKKHISFHVSRHTFATLLITSGADLYTVSKLLGHTNIKVTEIYAKIIDKKKEEAVSAIPLL